jgi:hypothetical protein
VHAKARAAFRASPFGNFLDDKSFFSNGPNTLQVRDHAYSIFCPVSAVKAQHFGTGKVGAGITELMVASCKLHAILD